MNRILLAAGLAALVTSAAFAQEAPQLIGKLSPNVQNAYNRDPALRSVQTPRIDTRTTGSVGKSLFGLGRLFEGGQPAPTYDLQRDDRYSGR